MAEGGNGFLNERVSSAENVAEILSEKSTSSDSELDLPGPFGDAGACSSAPPRPPPLPLAAAAAACAAVAGEMQGLDRLLQKQRNDRMFELRKLQHGERPVSNTDSKEKLEKFFAQSSDSTSQNTEQSSRPNSITVEVSGLLERRPVSSIIQSERFRRNLEDVIRGSVIRQERELQTALRLQSAGLQVQQRTPIVGNDVGDPSQHSDSWSQVSHVSSAHSSAAQAGEQQWHGGPPPPPPPPGPPQMSPGMPQSPWQQPQTPPWQQQQHAWSQWQNMAVQRPPWQQPPWQQPPWQQSPWQQSSWQQPPWQQQQQSWQRPPLPQQNQAPPVQPQQPWLTQQSRQPIPGQEQPHNVVAEIQQQQRESIVTEISDLVQRQLVSNTLESNFRGRLEVAMQQRLSNQESDGIAVMEAIRSLPHNPNHQRNDFSHLGIQSPSHPPATGPGHYGMAMASGGADMDAMRRQLEELQNMVRLSFDLQLDMQRAIRQEVAAALACQHSGDCDTNPANAASNTAQLATQPASEGSCLICLDNTVNTVLYQCGHMCVCLSCGMRLKGMGSHCPMCRAPIRDVIRAFKCQQPE